MSVSRSISRRTFLKESAAVSAMGALTACAGTNMNETLEENAMRNEDPAFGEGDPDAIARMCLTNPTTIDPYAVEDTAGVQVCYQLFDQLTEYDYEKGEVQPLAAMEWTANEDATEFRFHLVPGATFANGEPVTAESFKRGWTRMVDPTTNPTRPSHVAYHLEMVKGYQDLADGKTSDFAGVEAPADDLLVVRLSTPYADFPYVCSHPALSPVPQAAIDDPGTFWLAPIGNGPFMMAGQWEDGQEIDVVRYDDYYGVEKATVKGVRFEIQRDIETGWREFLAQNLDVCDVPNMQVPSAIQDYGVSEDGYTMTPGHQLLDGELLSVSYLLFNNNDSVLSNAELRKAISLAINRQAICDALYNGTRSPADNVVPPSLAGYEPEAWPYAKYDPEEAQKIVDENGPAGTDVTITCDTESNSADVMAMIQADLAKIGINAAIEMREHATMITDFSKGRYQIGLSGWAADYPILDNFLHPLFRSGAGDNRSFYSNPEVDAGIDEARAIVDDDDREAALQEVNRIIGEDAPLVPLTYYKSSICGSNRILWLRTSPLVKFYFAEAQIRG